MAVAGFGVFPHCLVKLGTVGKLSLDGRIRKSRGRLGTSFDQFVYGSTNKTCIKARQTVCVEMAAKTPFPSTKMMSPADLERATWLLGPFVRPLRGRGCCRVLITCTVDWHLPRRLLARHSVLSGNCIERGP